MTNVTEILVHWYAGRSQSEVAASLGVDRKTIKKYVTPAIDAGIIPGGPSMTAADWAELTGKWFPAVTDTRLWQTTLPQIEQHRDYFVDMLKAGVTQATIWQRLRDERDLPASLASLNRWVAANLPEEVRRDRVTVLMDEPEPGGEAQIDYGHLGAWVDPRSGKRRRVWAFVMVLPASRHMFVRPVLVMDQRAWTECHVAAFEFFGGVPARLVPDNLKTGVDKPDLYDPKINRSYAELAEHYTTLVDPARAAKPKDKLRVERPMPYVRDSFWRGREFVSLQHMQEQAVLWCRDVAGRRQCRPLGGAAPLSVFDAVEASELQAVPRKRFVLATWSTGTIGPDIHVRVGKSLYSVPWRHMGRRVDARETPTVVQIFDNGELIATHGRRPAGKSTDLSHYPPEKIAFKMRTPTWCRGQAADIGPSCVELIGGLLEVNALFRLRAAQGVLGLASKHGPARLEKACARAIEVGDPTYRTVKGILAAGTEVDPAPESTGDGGAAAHLHGPSQLFANVVALPTPDPEPAADNANPSVDHDTDAHDELGDHRTPAPIEPNRAAPGTDSEEAL
ncbi:Mobile element protein [Alloactinosynnema sp. L-07]|uniref:IS21 family transposase n=1 Tax=Alloactinosynnema sp. L-07 TaxID=1653480 RepID=UPI00065EF6AD|nr:IS21 family transposase [Alloactinosynnema sp. L-07]CRK57714.1 Mobile element protein [Alloactinosynnema sp. L-07]